MATFLTRTTGNPTLGTKFTVSAWVKINEVPGGSGSDRWLFGEFEDSSNHSYLYLRNSSAIGWYETNSSTTAASIITNGLAKDLNGWYHFMIAYDTTDSTQADRFKMYINGERQTSFSTNTNNISQNYTPRMNRTGRAYRIGGVSGHQTMFTGLMSHYHHCDGSALAPTVFGSTDSTTGEWKINASPSFTPGNNGFSILKDGNTITDQSANSNDFALGAGTLTKTEDCPSNIFCTWDPNYRSARKDMTLTHGNTFIFEQNSGDSGVSGTIAVSSGKYYWEQIIAQVNGTNAAVIGGLHTIEDFNESPTDANTANTVGLRANGNAYKGTADLGNFTSADPNGDIFGIAFDADNGSMYFWKNGTALNSGNAIITGMDMTKTWVPFGVQHGGARVTTSTNWGNGYFKTTAVSSAGTNASGIGIFEYNVPAGFTALSTKGLNE